MKMKALMSIITGVFMMFLLATPAQASGRTPITQPPTTTPEPVPQHKGKHINTIDILVGLAILACPVVAVYTRVTEGRWTWCGGDEERKEPPPDFGSAVKNDITPNNVKDKPRQFLIEAN